jgi:ABC-type branched-subunit amino acid transport system permease subunit
MFCIVVLGGSGSIPGILVGTLGMVVLPELLRDVGPTFLYKGINPVVILAVLLGGYLYGARHRLSGATVESGAIAGAFVLPPLLLGEPALSVIGMLMVLVAIIAIPLVRRRLDNALPWVAGAMTLYAVVMLVIGKGLGPAVEREISTFRIMDWRDGLMGVAMVVMMVLRPAGIIPERRRGIVVSAVAEANASPQAT